MDLYICLHLGNYHPDQGVAHLQQPRSFLHAPFQSTETSHLQATTIMTFIMINLSLSVLQQHINRIVQHVLFYIQPLLLHVLSMTVINVVKCVISPFFFIAVQYYIVSLLYSITLFHCCIVLHCITCQSSMFYLSTFLLQIVLIASSFLKIMKKVDMGILIHIFLWT